MPLQIDFAIAIGIFIVLLVTILTFTYSYLESYSSFKTQELRSIAYELFGSLFGRRNLPEKISLITELYRIPLAVTEMNGTDRNNVVVNISLDFDANCLNKAWFSTIRVYDEENLELESQLYNQTFCSEGFVKRSDLVFRTNLSAYQTKIFFVYFSGESSVIEPSYSLPFPEVTDLSVKIYPEQVLPMVSIRKIKALANLSYEEVVKVLGGQKFYVEIS